MHRYSTDMCVLVFGQFIFVSVGHFIGFWACRRSIWASLGSTSPSVWPSSPLRCEVKAKMKRESVVHWGLRDTQANRRKMCWPECALQLTWCTLLFWNILELSRHFNHKLMWFLQLFERSICKMTFQSLYIIFIEISRTPHSKIWTLMSEWD